MYFFDVAVEQTGVLVMQPVTLGFRVGRLCTCRTAPGVQFGYVGKEGNGRGIGFEAEIIVDFQRMYNRENETYNFLKRNVHFSLFFHPIKTKAFNHRLTGN